MFEQSKILITHSLQVVEMLLLCRVNVHQTYSYFVIKKSMAIFFMYLGTYFLFFKNTDIYISCNKSDNF